MSLGYSKLDREGKWIFYRCENCSGIACYHEKDPKRCKRCGSQALIQASPAKDEEEHEKRARMAGLW